MTKQNGKAGGDEKLSQTMSLTVKRLDTYQQVSWEANSMRLYLTRKATRVNNEIAWQHQVCH